MFYRKEYIFEFLKKIEQLIFFLVQVAKRKIVHLLWWTKQDPVKPALLLFCSFTVICLFKQSEFTIGLVMVSFGLIFPALTHKLQEANYQKGLFDERFAIFKQVSDTFWEWSRSDTSTENSKDFENLEKLRRNLDNIIYKSYFIFSTKTYNFLYEFRRHFVILVICNEEQHGDTAAYAKALAFFEPLRENIEALPSKFPELKIDNYRTKKI
jgi:hypothetical protein